MHRPTDHLDPLLICYPGGDFADRVRASVSAEAASADVSAETVTLKLHDRYPEMRIIVHAPKGPAGANSAATWIVFRDGYQRHHPDRHDRSGEQPDGVEPIRDRRGRPCATMPVALVVDDEPLVLMLVSAILTVRGWRVVSAADGVEALSKTEGVDLDLLITDHDMPGMDGATLAVRLCQRDPGLPVLVISGCPEEAHWAQGIRYDFLAKPFKIEELAARVESLTGFAMPVAGRGSLHA